MEEGMKINLTEISGMISETLKAMAITAGMRSGIYSELSPDKPLSSHDLAKRTAVDEAKLDKWMFFMEHLGIVKNDKGLYTLTEKGLLLSNSSPVKDLMGMFQLAEFYMESVINCPETFKEKRSLDKLSEGRISSSYQPKVSDPISIALLDIFKDNKLEGNDSLLDFGCGNGSFLRALQKNLPDALLTGVDKNLFSIEKGKKELIALNLTDKIKLLVGDITDNMSEFDDKSYDWITAINVFHFIPVQERMTVIENMFRICKKGVFLTEVIIENSPISAASNALVPLLYNDFTGFFKKEEADDLNQHLREKHKEYTQKILPVMQGTSYLVIMARN